MSGNTSFMMWGLCSWPRGVGGAFSLLCPWGLGTVRRGIPPLLLGIVLALLVAFPSEARRGGLEMSLSAVPK